MLKTHKNFSENLSRETKNSRRFFCSENEKILKSSMNPVSELIIPTDKFSDWLLEQTKNFGTSAKMVEGTFKGKEISSTITFKFNEGLLNQFDKSVLLASISEYRSGNNFVSFQHLFETLGGSNHLTFKKKEELSESVTKLMSTSVKIDMTEIVKNCYTGKKKIVEGMLLPCKIETIEINGQITEGTIHLLGDSPLFQVADAKNQIARLPSIILPKFSANKTSIPLNWFLLERVAEIVGSNSEVRKKHVRRLKNTILFETLYNKCGFGEFNKIQKSRLREKIKKILEHFKTLNYIDSFAFDKKNGEIFSIIISLND